MDRYLSPVLAMILVGCPEGRSVTREAQEAPAAADCAPVEAPSAEPVPRSFYTRHGDGASLPGEPVRAVATCDLGDVAIGGHCTWGKEPGSVAPIEAGAVLGPADEPVGWTCAGLVAADHDTHGTAYAFAVCEVAP